MHHLITVDRIFGSAGDGAVYDGKIGATESVHTQQLTYILLYSTGVAILYIPGDQGPDVMHSFNEGVARGRPPRPGQDERNMQVQVSSTVTYRYFSRKPSDTKIRPLRLPIRVRSTCSSSLRSLMVLAVSTASKSQTSWQSLLNYLLTTTPPVLIKLSVVNQSFTVVITGEEFLTDISSCSIKCGHQVQGAASASLAGKSRCLLLIAKTALSAGFSSHRKRRSISRHNTNTYSAPV